MPTKSMAILPSFHDGESSVTKGRGISKEEFESGAQVALVTERFAQINNLQVGDNITLQLLFADYKSSPGYAFGYNGGICEYSLLNASGDLYQPFWEADYGIVGIYNFTGHQIPMTQTSEIGRDEVIIPAKSVEKTDSNNIVDYGPMQSGTTSFQIVNGAISDFEEKVSQLPESAFLEISYDDNGYEQISANLQIARNSAVLLTIVSVLSTLAILTFLLYFYVVKQKKQTAIERSLGMTKAECRISLMGGMIILVATAVIAGSILSGFIEENLASNDEENEAVYSMQYSNWSEEIADMDFAEDISSQQDIIISISVPVGILLFTVILGIILVNKNLEIEPMELLSAKEE